MCCDINLLVQKTWTSKDQAGYLTCPIDLDKLISGRTFCVEIDDFTL